MNNIKIGRIVLSLWFTIFFSSLHANDTIKLQLKWFHSFQFAGYYMAKERGYYSDVNLDVEIIERDPSKNNIEQVLDGEAHYGVADSAILLYRAQGKPLRVIASIFQHSPIVYLSKRSSGIVSPYEMRGKKISYQKNLNDSILLAMLQSANIHEDEYTHIPLDFSAQNFIDDEVDVISVYLSDQPYFFKQKGIEFNIINPLNYGFDFYGDNLFTTDYEINHHPDRVKRFREASLKGWKYALNHIDETIAVIKNKYHAQSSIEHLHHEAKVTKGLMLFDIIDIGFTDPNRFYRIAKVYEQAGKAKKEHLDRALETFIYDPTQTSNEWRKFLYLLGGLLTVALFVVLFLYLVNKRLNRLVIKKTQEQNNLLTLFEQGDSVLFRWRNDPNWSIEYVSSNVQNLLGYCKEEFLDNKVLYAHTIHPQDLRQVSSEVNQAVTQKSNFFKHEPYRIITKNGEVKWVLDHTVFNRNEKGEITHFVGYVIDITDHQTIRQNLEKFIETQDNIVFLSDGKEITFANRKFFDFLGYRNLASFKATHQCICKLFIQNDRFFHLKRLDSNANWIEEIKKLNPLQRVVSIIGENGQPHAFSITINRFDEELSIITFSDITQTMMEHIRLEEKTIHDKLTGAFNREYFEQNIQHFIDHTQRLSNYLGIAFVDVDYFKLVNDTYGHDVGDIFLQELVNLIEIHIKNDDRLIRWGGEEFIILSHVPSLEAFTKQLERLRTLVEHHEFEIVGHKTCSIGATLYQKDEPIDQSIKRSDQALYKAKESGRNQVVVY